MEPRGDVDTATASASAGLVPRDSSRDTCSSAELTPQPSLNMLDECDRTTSLLLSQSLSAVSDDWDFKITDWVRLRENFRKDCGRDQELDSIGSDFASPSAPSMTSSRGGTTARLAGLLLETWMDGMPALGADTFFPRSRVKRDRPLAEACPDG